MVMPGDNTEMKVDLIQPIAMEEGLRLRHPRGWPHRRCRPRHQDPQVILNPPAEPGLGPSPRVASSGWPAPGVATAAARRGLAKARVARGTTRQVARRVRIPRALTSGRAMAGEPSAPPPGRGRGKFAIVDDRGPGRLSREPTRRGPRHRKMSSRAARGARRDTPDLGGRTTVATAEQARPARHVRRTPCARAVTRKRVHRSHGGTEDPHPAEGLRPRGHRQLGAQDRRHGRRARVRPWPARCRCRLRRTSSA